MAVADLDGPALDALIADSPLPVVVEFWGATCTPCLAMAPLVDAVAERLAGRATVVKLDAEAHPGAAAQHRVQSLPSFVLFHRGRDVDELVGAFPADQLHFELERMLGRCR
ncbi:MAG: thioredoxin family protein [Acidimicrobiales bacterium]